METSKKWPVITELHQSTNKNNLDRKTNGWTDRKYRISWPQSAAVPYPSVHDRGNNEGKWNILDLESTRWILVAEKKNECCETLNNETNDRSSVAHFIIKQLKHEGRNGCNDSNEEIGTGQPNESRAGNVKNQTSWIHQRYGRHTAKKIVTQCRWNITVPILTHKTVEVVSFQLYSWALHTLLDRRQWI